jgi:hypothetical protein
MNDISKIIKGNVYNILNNDPQIKITVDEIEAIVKAQIAAMSQLYPGIVLDTENICREILLNCNTWMGNPTIVSDPTNHEPWLYDRKAEVSWKFWNRYLSYMIKTIGYPRQIVDKMASLTDLILNNLEDPLRKGMWDRRGMVVGQVQSGKTQNYIGLVCKAVDAGYKIIIVLAGLNNDLRSQTQRRLDEGFLGYDSRKRDSYSQKGSRIGVGLQMEYTDLIAHTLTSSESDGDYKMSAHRSVTIQPGGDPILLVVKKNYHVLNHILRWFKGKSINKQISGIPLLLIDDEADNASIDGRAVERDKHTGHPLDENDPTTINRKIRQILNYFQQSAYVGYTATPFANIFIFPRVEGYENKRYKEDLFPRSFIINLPPPSNYIGPTKVFGLTRNLDSNNNNKPLPVLKTVSDYESYIPKKHKKNHPVDELPPSLKEAIRSFIVSCAARAARGQVRRHKSMLVHVTRFNNVQRQVRDLVEEELLNYQRSLEFEGKSFGETPLHDDLEKLWFRDFVPATREIMDRIPDTLITEITWDTVKKYLYTEAAKIQVKTVNGEAREVLDYVEHVNGMSVIAIGGNKLSRGLTLEGLSVSYYLRASRMYDTLLQMGRWFGYKDGFLDFCKLYTTRELMSWYQHIASANEELRREFEYMSIRGSNPEEYGLRVKSHPGGILKITSAYKMRNNLELSITFSGHLIETTRFSKKKNINDNNFKNTDAWIKSLGNPTPDKKQQESSSYIWNKIDSGKIMDYLSNRYKICNMFSGADPEHIAKYIKDMNGKNELLSWTVVLVSAKRSNAIKSNIGGNEVLLPYRTDTGDDDGILYMLSKSHMISRSDEWIDLSEQQYKDALQRTINEWKETRRQKKCPRAPGGQHVRAVRPVSKGLLIIYPLEIRSQRKEGVETLAYPVIGYAISFPYSRKSTAIRYSVNRTYWKNLYEDDE